MRRVCDVGPTVRGDGLYQVRYGPLTIGSPAWHAWLAAPGYDHDAFAFPAAHGGWHRALREWRRQRPYWYVKVRVGKAVKRFYLGRPADLDAARLQAVAVAIAAARAAVGAPL
jgi:hypothetical protein